MDQPNSAPSPKRVSPLAIWIPIIMIMLGGVVFYNYLVTQSLKQPQEKDRPPYLGRLEKDLILTERSGKTVQLSQLKGKFIVAGYVYTRCPRGCAVVVSKMKKLYEEFGQDPRVQFLSFTVDPDDTPEILSDFATRFGIKGDNWWFVNGPKAEVRNYLTFQFKFAGVKEIPEAERMSPDDKYMHDMKVAIVDDKGHLRGHYDIANMDPEYETFWAAKVRKDLKYILSNSEEPR